MTIDSDRKQGRRLCRIGGENIERCSENENRKQGLLCKQGVVIKTLKSHSQVIYIAFMEQKINHESSSPILKQRSKKLRTRTSRQAARKRARSADGGLVDLRNLHSNGRVPQHSSLSQLDGGDSGRAMRTVLKDSDLLRLIVSYVVSSSQSIDEGLGDLYQASLVSKGWSAVIQNSPSLWMQALQLEWAFCEPSVGNCNGRDSMALYALNFLQSLQGPLGKSELDAILDTEMIDQDVSRRNIGLELDPRGEMEINYGLSCVEHVRLSENLAVIVIGHESNRNGRRDASMTTMVVDTERRFSDARNSQDRNNSIRVNELFDISTAEDNFRVTYFPNAMIRLKSRLEPRLLSTAKKLSNSNLLTLLNVACFSHSVPWSMELLSLAEYFTSEKKNVETRTSLSYFDEVQLCASRFDKDVFTNGLGGQTIDSVLSKGRLLSPINIDKFARKICVRFGSSEQGIEFTKDLIPPCGKLVGPSSLWNRKYFRSGILQN